MTTEEFKNTIKKIASYHSIYLGVEEGDSCFYITSGDKVYANVSKLDCYLIGTEYTAFKELKDRLKLDLLNTIYELAKTPISKRNPQQRYRIFLKLIPDSSFKYLCKRCGSIDKLELDVESNIDSKFTLKEIDEIKEKYDTDLKDFEIIEVNDDI